MEKVTFSVVGKQVIKSKDQTYFFVHVVGPFDQRAVASGAMGKRAFSTSVSQDEFARIELRDYSGYIVSSGRYTNLIFES